MIDVKEAAKKAVEYFQDLNMEKVHDINLEEVEISTDKKQWLVTVGYNKEGMGDTMREYKQFVIDIETGDIVSMKIRKI